ncbi:MAG: pentapeptide repeat-containing protein [Bacteroidales bacterium]|jgi:fluoroquinolone resistance protein|nr:pentapeptide repeat-containing protein [Bacteroidales bacterium]
MSPYTENKTFKSIQSNKNMLKQGDYENCSFVNCDFSNADLSDFTFIDCTFTDCNLSVAILHNTIFRDITFKSCKMLGLHLYDCNTFGLSFSFENCVLNHSSFYKTQCKKTVFSNSELQEVDFTECDVTEAQFLNCNLTNASFDNTILEKADLRSSYNYKIAPEINRIKKATFSIHGLPGLLDKYDIEIVDM